MFREAVLALERSGHELCVLHGYKSYPERIDSDVDAVSRDPGSIPRILSEQGVADVVQVFHHEAISFILRGRGGDTRDLLNLDVATGCAHEGLVLMGAEELLSTYRPFKFFKVPSPGREFVCYLVRRAAKGSLDDTRAARLGELYAEDPAECAEQVRRAFPKPEAALILEAARSGSWAPVRGRLEGLYQAAVSDKRRAHPLGGLRHRLDAFRRRADRLLRPPGLMVALLGVDGAGKSTVMSRVEGDLAPIFWSVKRYHRRPLASALRWRERYFSRGRTESRESPETVVTSAPHEPHAMPQRSLVASLAKLGFWWVDYALFGYALDVRPRLVRHALVMFDRYYDDLLVDPRRYRYGGPLWLARLVGRLVPRPHLVVLLDAPAELLWARKREVAFEETIRQREAYLKLVGSLSNGHVVDASEPLDRVVTNVERIILDYMQGRVGHRLDL